MDILEQMCKGIIKPNSKRTTGKSRLKSYVKVDSIRDWAINSKLKFEGQLEYKCDGLFKSKVEGTK